MLARGSWSVAGNCGGLVDYNERGGTGTVDSIPARLNLLPPKINSAEAMLLTFSVAT